MFNKFTFKRFVNLVTFFIVAGFLLIGCAPVGPDYKKVGFETPDNWSTQMERGLDMSQPKPNTLAEWWKVFNDPTLEKLQEKAVSDNKDLKMALSRIRQARYMRGITKSNLFPQLDATGTVQSTMGSENMGSPSGGTERKYYMAGFDVAWELDIFGGLRRSVEAAQAELEAMFADFNDVYITLMSEVALNYIEACMYQNQLSILYQNVDIQRKTYELNKSRYKSGIIDELVLQQSLTNLNQSMSQIPPLVAMLSAAKNRIAILIGEMPENIDTYLPEIGEIPNVPLQVAVGIPAETLRRRPDIRRAERYLAAQTARIGVATAELYPKFQLPGTIGIEAIKFDNFFESDSLFWNVGPIFSWKLFSAGAVRLGIKLETEKQKEALLNYETTVLKALQEVEDALKDYMEEQKRYDSLSEAVKAARRTEMLAVDKYKAGLTDFYVVMDAQRTLLDLENQLVQSKGKISTNLARLYKALGGGWKGMNEYLEENLQPSESKEILEISKSK